MSLLVEVRKHPRIVDGELVKVGEPCRLPNALALALENKGMVAWPQERVAIAEAKAKSDKRKASRAKQKAKKEAETKGSK